MPQETRNPMNPGFTPLAEYAFLAVDGAKAAEFLQGQLTCDLRQAGSGHVLRGAWCSPKGRVLCSLLVWQPEPARVLLRLREDLADDTAAQLQRYGQFSRVRIARAPLGCIGLAGAVPDAPAEGSVQPEGDGFVVARDAAGERQELWVPLESVDGWVARLWGPRERITPGSWTLARLRAGDAEVQAATRELFLPQMLGYDANGTVSFRKGCYTGQEVVARAHYRGGVKRHLAHLRGEGPPPAPGSELLAGERKAGTVVESAPCDGGFELLAVLTDEVIDAGAQGLCTAAGEPLGLPA